MIAHKTGKEEALQLVKEATSAFFQLASSFDEKELNAKRAHDTWTAGQVIEHVTRSNVNITQEMLKPGQISGRAPEAGVENLKSIFLNFEKKLQSPAFILPTKDSYLKNTLVAELKKSIDDLIEAGQKEDLFEIIHHAIFGDVTRLETLYFVVYHTQRHRHQLSNIQRMVRNGQN